ncbi:endonuclease/exonuclease/phosphatase family protein [Cellulosimicrobium marinum]|uniref:endonuclease/exonuclease/phosphatase family protein n=1 Tax=Cellulosimicrobium marinum TaxID=1638992 RepID=UPI001E469DA9|nr:endonuclease/exonuclease/phosphatase family protein [Cellulosimicrobium marinum]MCB7135172.1 endonuclease/exonuclease/phosphatase family protein [Cellulosimicrobium marinum]
MTSTATALPPARVATRRRPGGPVLGVVLGLATAAVVAMTLVRLVPFDAAVPFAQLVGLTPWVAGAAALLLVVVLLARRRALALLVAACVVGQALWVVPFFVPEERAPATGSAPLRVLGANAWLGQADARQVVDLVRAEDVQVLAVVELTADFRERLVAEGLEEVLPHHVDDKAGNGSEGSGLWSALPLTDVDLTPFSTFAMPSATVELDGRPVRVTAVHPVPPLLRTTSTWHDELLRLGARARADAQPQVLVGDFNATYDHASFRALLGDRFQDATRSAGHGLNLSWSARPGTPDLLDLDHVVTDRENVVTDVGSVAVRGSDHRAILATVHVPRP